MCFSLSYLIILFKDYSKLCYEHGGQRYHLQAKVWSCRTTTSWANDTGPPSVIIIIALKILLYASKALHGVTPMYMTDLISPKVPRWAVKSADQHLLEQPTEKLKLIGLSAFSVCVPYLRNSHPFEIIWSRELWKSTQDLVLEIFEDRESSLESSFATREWLSTYLWAVLYRVRIT